MAEFDLGRAISVECWVWIDRESPMPVVLSCGEFNATGWFVQRFGGGWRWHLGGISCDGGRPAIGRWVHLVGTFNGSQARFVSRRPAGRVGRLLSQHGRLRRPAGRRPILRPIAPISNPRPHDRHQDLPPALKAEEIAAKFAAGRKR